MAVRPRSNGFQVDFSHAGSRIRKDGFTSSLEAEQWEREARTRLEQGKPLSEAVNAQDRPCTMRGLCDRVTALVWKGQRAEDTAVKNADDVVTLLGEKRDPKTITTTAIDSMVEEFGRKGLSNATINRKLAALSKMLHFAQQRGWITAVPHIARRRENEHRIRWLTAEEEGRVLAWFEFTGRRTMKDWVTFLIDTGCRASEALEIEWPAVADGKWVQIPPTKRGNPRAIPMTPRVQEIVERRRKAAPQDTLGLFHDLDYWQANYAWDQMRAHFKLDTDAEFVIHMLRHTFCSRLAQRGVALQVIQQLAGHKTISVTMRYAHLAPANLLKAMEVLA